MTVVSSAAKTTSSVAAAAAPSATIRQPDWHMPKGTPVPMLHVANSLTRKKELFVPENDRKVTWYCCGPTVYNSSHMGHARAYITFDILRRVLEDFFGYNVQYVMNITDIDDKIIASARQNHLFELFQTQNPALTAELISIADSAWSLFVTKKFEVHHQNVASDWQAFIDRCAAESVASAAKDEKFGMYFKTATSSLDAITKAKNGAISIKDFYKSTKDIFSTWLDEKQGSSVKKSKIFRDFAAYWEDEFFVDMDRLNIRRPDVLTRVSEYVPEIIRFVERIIANGFAYELDQSVYFDTVRFDKTEGHSYAKLEPWSAGNIKLLQEGEGDLSTSTTSKRSSADFALWKKSKPGEPSWSSPWGEGRPGWHIECSAMAGEVLGEKIDIHSGGVDLTFPHHDNELAQSEGHFNCSQWINYFLHAGHLHIEGQKMSKSLKNFITIREALQQHTASQIRIMYLLHQWDATLDYGVGSMSEARSVEAAINNFLSLVKAVVQESKFSSSKAAASDAPPQHNYSDLEKALSNQLFERQSGVYAALCDSFNTPVAMSEIRQLVASANQYYQDKVKAGVAPNPDLLSKVGKYITGLMRTFGVFPDANPDFGAPTASTFQNLEDALLPYLRALSVYRDRVRELAQKTADHREFLELSDRLRDEDMADLGVLFEDKADGKALVKLVDRETLARQKQEKVVKELERQREKEERQQALAAKKAERLEKGRMPPSEMFKTDEFSAWDEQGVPTKDKEGEDLAKSRRKKLEKEHAAQKKLHADFLAAKESGEMQ